MSHIEGKTILLIAGQPKAGTTSLFDWLAQHPQIAAGKLKEIRFFLDPKYPLQAPARFNGTNLDSYLSLFNTPERNVLLDATPDYIGCTAPLSLPSIHPATKAIIILRDPEERMISAYRFFRSHGRIPMSMTFDAYVAKQHAEGVTETTDVQWRALDHCRTDHYLTLWREAYGKNLLVLDFNDLRRDPKRMVDKICDFAGLKRSEAIETVQSNKTQSYKYPGLYSAYSKVRRRIATRMIHHQWVYRMLRPFGRMLFKVLGRNQTNDIRIDVSEATRVILADYKSAM